MVRDQLIDIIKFTVSLGIDVQLNTNGAFIDSNYIDELDSAGLKILHFSFDSLKESTFLYLRGIKNRSIYIRTKKNIEYAVTKKNIKTYIEPTITKYNINEILDIYNYALNIGVDVVEIQPLLPFGRADMEIMPNLNDLSKLVDKLLECENIKTKIKFWCLYIKLCDSNKNLLEHYVGCKCAFETIYISVNGDIFPCGFAQNISGACVGNIFKSKGLISNILDDIWDNNKLINRFRYEIPMECKECKIESLCHNSVR